MTMIRLITRLLVLFVIGIMPLEGSLIQPSPAMANHAVPTSPDDGTLCGQPECPEAASPQPTTFRAPTVGAVQRPASTGADILPTTTIAYLEIRRPSKLGNSILQHPLRSSIEELKEVEQALSQREVAQLRGLLVLLENKTGLRWPKLLQAISGQGIYVGLDRRAGGVVLLVHANSANRLKETAGFVLGLLKSDAENKGEPSPYQIEEYRGHKVARFDEGLLSRVDDWLLFSNRQQLARRVADNLIDGADDALSQKPKFAAAHRTGQGRDVWGFVDLAALRERDVARELLGGQSQNAAVELLFGGVLEALKQAPHAFFGASVNQDAIEVDAEIPFDATQANPHRAFFFGPQGKAQAPPRLMVEQPLLDFVAYRDIGAWWMHKEDLFEENVVAQLAQADSQLSNFFAGLSFGEDVLESFQPGVQIVATPQTFSPSYRPDIKLPAVALIARVKDPDIHRRLRISLHNLVGFANLQLAMNGDPQLEIHKEETDEGRIDSAVYLVDEESPDGLIHYNFSPSLATHGEYLILASTRELSRELVSAAAAKGRDTHSSSDELIHTALRLDGPLIRQAIQENREALIVQRMIEEGSERENAARQIGTLIGLVDLVQEVEFQLINRPEKNRIGLHLRFRLNNKKPTKKEPTK